MLVMELLPIFTSPLTLGLEVDQVEHLCTRFKTTLIEFLFKLKYFGMAKTANISTTDMTGYSKQERAAAWIMLSDRLTSI